MLCLRKVPSSPPNSTSRKNLQSLFLCEFSSMFAHKTLNLLSKTELSNFVQ